MLADGHSALDTVEAVIQVLEDDAAFNAGRGAVLTEDGRVELDASIMDGKSLACGAVASVTRVKNPIVLARRVMTETKHVLLAGAGADKFAEQQQVPLVDSDYFLSRHVSPHDPLFDRSDQPHFGTVGCVVLDAEGNLAAGTSTGGTSKKLPGRVGDSPIVGAGTYAANDTCAVSGTGIGEEYIRHSVAYDVAAQMRYAGRPMEDAIDEIMTKRLKPGVGGLIAVSRDGEIVMQHNTRGMSCGAADSNGRFETFLKTDIAAKTAIDPQRETITALLREQVAAWNAGDIDAFMKPYWKSDQLTFSSGGTTTRGYNATLARYKHRYPTVAEMGTLDFSELDFLTLGAEAIQVLGTWHLVDSHGEPVGGRFTLVFRRLEDGWKIVHDHTSALPPTEK
jgi:beta-aspartyl-peptidase (threonine type)